MITLARWGGREVLMRASCLLWVMLVHGGFASHPNQQPWGV